MASQNGTVEGRWTGLAEEAGIALRSVDNALVHLREAGMLEVVRKGKPSTYRVNLDWMPVREKLAA
jgi:DNA-binding transcriptional regulator PaaX